MLRNTHLLAVGPLRTQLQALQQQQAELVKAEPPDLAAIGDNVMQRRGLRQTLREMSKSYRETALLILTTDEQRRKVALVQRALRLVRQAGPLSKVGLVRLPRRRR